MEIHIGDLFGLQSRPMWIIVGAASAGARVELYPLTREENVD